MSDFIWKKPYTLKTLWVLSFFLKKLLYYEKSPFCNYNWPFKNSKKTISNSKVNDFNLHFCNIHISLRKIYLQLCQWPGLLVQNLSSCQFFLLKVILSQSFYRMSLILTHYRLVLLIYNPWKHQKTFRFSDAFRGYRKATVGCNGLNTIKQFTFSEVYGMANFLWAGITPPLPSLVDQTYYACSIPLQLKPNLATYW